MWSASPFARLFLWLWRAAAGLPAPTPRRAAAPNRRSIPALCTVLVVVGAASCRDAVAPTSAASRVAVAPRRDAATSTTPGFTATLGVDAHGGAGNYVMGTYATMVLARITADGIIAGSGTSTNPNNPTPPQPGRWDPGGAFSYAYNSCVGSVGLFSNAVNGPNPISFCDWYDQQPLNAHYETYGYVQGQVTVGRSPMDHPCADRPQYYQCTYSFSGAQTVTVTPVAATLALTAAPTSIAPGDSVVFTLAITQDAAGGYAVPRSITGVRWVVNGVQKTSPCSFPGTGTCTAFPTESGTLFVDAVVNGSALTVSARVRVVPCPVGDTLLDEPAIRAGLDSMWQQVHIQLPPPQRVERGSWGFYDSAHVTYTSRLSPPASTDTPCENANVPSFPLPGIPVISAHAHPLFALDTLPWQQCRKPAPPPGTFYRIGHTYGGPSPADYARVYED